MNTTHTIQTLLEIAGVAALTLGFIFEQRIARWERRTIRKLLWTVTKITEGRKQKCAQQ